MYCPTCGSEERQPAQFCRSCGTDMRVVRQSLERPDEITAAASSARDMVGRAIADKIRETPPEMLKKVAEDVLPEIEKFLESPEERRLRRLRSGVITSMIGAGVGVLAKLLVFFVSGLEPDVFNMLVTLFGGGIILFFIGVGVIVNAYFFTLPSKRLPASALTGKYSEIDGPRATPLPLRDASTASPLPPVSVTEHTTQHLANKSNT